jgi:hypothetical protein
MLTRSLFFLATIVLTAEAATLEKPQITCQLPSCAFMGATCLAQGSTICGPPKDGSAGAALYVCEGGVYIQEGVCIVRNIIFERLSIFPMLTVRAVRELSYANFFQRRMHVG